MIDCTTDVVEASYRLARAFVSGSRLVVHAPTCVDHAHHVVVEFIHPVIAGTRSLPATVSTDTNSAIRSDCALVIGDRARADDTGADLYIGTDSTDAEIMRTYHLLWELVQVWLEHPGLVGAPATDGSDSTGFLYPFLDASEDDETALRRSLEASAADKHDESQRLATETLQDNSAHIDDAARAIAAALADGGRVITMGNGGSSTDAARIVRLLTTAGADAISLSTDYAVLSALANDLGAERMFARQIEALARPGDVLVGCSTSGTSRNLLAAFELAAAGGVVGVGISGYGGGAFVHQDGVAHCLAVGSSSVHRIQEAQSTIITALCERAVGGRVAA